MLIRKDETVVERASRPSTRNANIGDPFGIKFIGRDFKAAYPYHTLSPSHKLFFSERGVDWTRREPRRMI
jgi:hypothetical protein